MTQKHPLLTLLAMFFFAGSAEAEQRFAIVIGANAGWSNDRPLRHAESDAERVRDALVELGSFPADRVAVLRDPDTAEVRAQLRRLSQTLRALGDNTLVFFYYSGHADEVNLHLRGLPMSHEELYGHLRDLPGTVRIGVIDACRAGSILGAKGGAPVAPFQVRVDEPVRGLAVLTSSGADELSQETRALAGSVFTHHLVSGLRGAADANRSGQVTLSEVYQYAFARTEADTASSLVPQRPAFRFELKGQGEVVLTRVGSATSALVLPRGDGRRYVVVDRREWHLIAEGRSSEERDVVLALSPGEYQVKRVLADQLEVATMSLESGLQVKAGTLSYVNRPLSAGFVKGSPSPGDVTEQREYRRREGLRLLADGEAGAALGIFEELLKVRPDDRASLRGKARALTRMAEAYERVGDHEKERNALRKALLVDPSLSEDPDFQAWYRRLSELEGKERRDAEIRNQVEADVRSNPRLKRRFGVYADFISTRGMLVIGGTYKLQEKLYLTAGVDLPGPGLDVGVRFLPVSWYVSPYVGAGGHISANTFGKKTTGNSSVRVQDVQYSYWDVFGTAAHVDAGLQYFGGLGFSAEVGLGLLLFKPPDAKVQTMVLPNFSVGWNF